MGVHGGSGREPKGGTDAGSLAREATRPRNTAPLAARVAGAALIVAAIVVTTAAAGLALTRALAPERLPVRLSDATLTVVLALTAALLWAATLLWLVPRWQVVAWRAGREVDPKEAFDVENDARATLGQVLGGIAVLAGLVVAWQQLGQTLQNLRVSEEGQITDRFTRAIDQLGDPDLTVRLGGIYALERIARDSPRDYPATMEILTAFARRLQPPALATPGADPVATTPEDVAAAIRVIGRRTPAQIAQETSAGLDCLHLEQARLPGADLEGYNLTRVCLGGANLTGASLTGAELAGDDLTGADLTGANLEDIDLRGATLSGARFTGANLRGANLAEANLLSADLQGAILLQTNLAATDLFDANLANATVSTDLSTARHLTAAQLDAALLDRGSRLPAGIAATPDF